MKTRQSNTFTAARIARWGLALSATALLLPGHALAWSGETWGSSDRATIESRASTMMHNRWTPANNMNNFGYGSTWRMFYRGTTYTGMAYSQNNPQENWTEFKSLVDRTGGGNTYYGNDCSGFVSIAWRLPSRYTTWTFEDDATKSGGYVSSLGAIGSGQNAGLQLGDALNKSSDHIVLFKSRTASGILTMEQTPWTARQREWSWAQLAKYRPIRRNNLVAGTPTPSAGQGVVTAAQLNVRSGPGSDFGSVGVLNQNEIVSVQCRIGGTSATGTEGTTTQWYRIGAGRFVSAAHVRVSQAPAVCTTNGTVNASTLNVRSGPGSSYSVVSTVSQNQTVGIQCRSTGSTATGTEGSTNQWYRIGTGRFVSAAWVKPAGTIYVCR